MNNNDHPRAPERGWEGKLGPCHAHCGQNELSLQLPILETQFGLPPIEWPNSLLWLPIASSPQSDLVQVMWDFHSTLKITQHLASIQKLCIRMIMHGSCVTLSKSTLALFPCREGDCESTPPASCSSPKWHAEQEKEKQTKQKTHLFQKWHKNQIFPFQHIATSVFNWQPPSVWRQMKISFPDPLWSFLWILARTMTGKAKKLKSTKLFFSS